jgi:hypothetical protein
MEYVTTREAKRESRVTEYGPIGNFIGIDDRAVIADLRAIIEGQPLPGPGAE